ncbi:MAG: S-layer family protein, partial [Cyanobacteria bacterium J055]
TPVGLQVQPGNTLALVGGDITVPGGKLSAFGGRIELGAVAANGRVTIDPLPDNPSAFRLSYPPEQTFQDILVSELGAIDTSGDGGGSIQLQGRNVRIIGGSFVEANNFGVKPGGTLEIRASEWVEVSGTGPLDGPLDAPTAIAGAFTPQFSSLSTNTFGLGKGGDLRIDTRHLIVRDGGEVEAGSLGPGLGGLLSIRASESMEVSGQAPLLGFAPRLGQASLGLGFGESFLAEAFTVSTVSSANGNSGNAGDVEIETGQLRVRNGGVITSLPAGSGHGGQLTVRVSEGVEVRGTTASGEFASSITAGTFGSGNSGNVTVIAPKVTLREGGAIVSTSFNLGNAGTVTILASESVELAGRVGRNASTLEARTLGRGDAGSVNVTTGNLSVRDGGRINVSGSQTAQAGNVNIGARSIELDRGTLSATTTAGDRGNITLETGNLQLRHNSQITTNAGSANGGNINIDTDTLVALENSDITANARQGRGGQVLIAAQGIFGTAFRDQLTPESDITATSDLGTEFSGTVTLTTPDVDATAGLVELQGETTDRTDRIVSTCGAAEGSSFTITGRGGLPENPIETLNSQIVWEDLRTLIDYREETQEIVQTLPLPAPEPRRELVEATGWIVREDGTVELIASGDRSSSDWQPTPDCQDGAVHAEGDR